MIRLFFLVFLFAASKNKPAAQPGPPPTFLKIREIQISGNKKTRPAVILREMEIAPGDSVLLSNLTETLGRNRLRLMNTGLFSEVKINIKNWSGDQTISLFVEVEESWAIYPIPVFRLADRNFNVWWKEFDHSFQRVFYGLDLYHFNLTGNNDRFKIGAQFGYAQRFEVNYSHPGINRKRTLGLESEIFYARLREVPLKTLDNRLLFLFRPDQNLGQQWRISTSLNWRPALFTTHKLALERRENQIADTIARELNPDYFLKNRARQKHFSLIYSIQHDRRDIRPYPLHGWFGRLEIRQNGLLPNDDLHLARFVFRLDKYFSFSKKVSLEMISGGKFSLPRRKTPYFNNQSLGYGNDFVRGYEYYVVDGLDFGLLKTGLHFRLFDKNIQLGKTMPLKSFRLFPLKIYLAVNNDFGYANDPYFSNKNPLGNRVLHGYGIGLDVVGYYTRVGQFEISRNHRGETGFYFRVRDEF